MYNVFNCHNVAKHRVLPGIVTVQCNVMCFKKSFTTSKAYMQLFRGHVQCLELS
jgi:hypothetical protein